MPRKEIKVFMIIDVAMRRQGIGQESHETPCLFRFIDDLNSIDKGISTRRIVERRENSHRRGFAGAIRADETKDVARRELERDVIDCTGSAEITDQVDNLDFHFVPRVNDYWGVSFRMPKTTAAVSSDSTQPADFRGMATCR